MSFSVNSIPKCSLYIKGSNADDDVPPQAIAFQLTVGTLFILLSCVGINVKICYNKQVINYAYE